MIADAIKADDLRFDSLWLDDHLLNFHTPPENRFEAWTALSYLSAITKQIRLGHLVLCNSFRNPALLAKMIASLDVLSEGRINLGIGAGWHEPEYKAFGYQFRSSGDRVRRLSEALAMMKGLFVMNDFDFHGEHYQIEGSQIFPKPIQSPFPIIVGANKPRMIKLAVSQGTGINTTAHDIDQLRSIFRLVEEECDKIGKPYHSFLKSYFTRIHFTKDMEERKQVIKEYHAMWNPQPPIEYFDKLMIGPLDFVKQKMVKYIDEVDIDYMMVACLGTEEIQGPFELLRDEVISEFK